MQIAQKSCLFRFFPLCISTVSMQEKKKNQEKKRKKGRAKTKNKKFRLKIRKKEKKEKEKKCDIKLLLDLSTGSRETTTLRKAIDRRTH